MLSHQVTGFTNLKAVKDWLESSNLSYTEKFFLPIAHQYTSSLGWMNRRIGYWHGLTIDGLVGVFLYRIVPTRPDIPEYHWIVVGPKWPYPEYNKLGVDQSELVDKRYSGLPHAYIWTGHPDFSDRNSAPNPACALDSYVGVIGEWVHAIKTDGDLSEVFPVEVPSGKTALEYADDVHSLLEKIETEIIPQFAEDLNAPRGL